MKMMYKITMLLFLVLIINKKVDGQWMNDPQNPQVICSEENTRDRVQSQPDGDGGVYVFWMDKRTEFYHSDVYGQHYNSEGIALWENNGREILNYTASIDKYTTFRNETSGELFIASYTTGSATADSLRVRKLNEDGSASWSSDLAISEENSCTPPNYIISLHNIQITVTNDYYALVYESTLCGGYTQLFLNAFNDAGELLTPYYGTAITGAGVWFLQPTYDDSGDIFISSTYFDNGTEAQLARVSMDGLLVFPSINMSSGPTSLNYMYRTISDASGVTFMWVADDNIYARRFDNAGNQLWDDNTLNVCIAGGAQDAFHMEILGNEISVVWRDGRPGVVGNAAIYAQRFNLDGDILWQTDGIEVADLNTYITYPKFAFNDEGDMIVCHTSNVVGMTVHKVLDDGSVLYGSTGVVQCIPAYNQNSEDFKLIQSGENVILSWQNDTFENEIYISRAYPQTTAVFQNVVACESYTLNNEVYTESGLYVIELPNDTLLSLELSILNIEAMATTDGSMLTATNIEGNFTWYNCDTNTSLIVGGNTFTPTITGNYALIVEQSGCIDTSDCYLINVTAVQEWKKPIQLSLFPNPTNNILNIHSDTPLRNVKIAIYNSQGVLILQSENISFSHYSLDVFSLATGLYNLVIYDQDGFYSDSFYKE